MEQGINVLSLFDGMSCGQIALERLGIKINKYFASEIEPPSITVTQRNFKKTIQLGDVNFIKGNSLPKINLLMAGSPCQDLSIANPNGKGLLGDKSSLFYQFVRLKEEVNPDYFLLENVMMKKQWINEITNILGVKPIIINSELVSAQSRKRIYWTNIKVNTMPLDKKQVIKDILQDQVADRFFINKDYDLLNETNKGFVAQLKIKGMDSIRRIYGTDGKMATLTTCSGGYRHPKILQLNSSKESGGKQPYMQNRIFDEIGKSTALTSFCNKLNVFTKGTIRRLTPIECERLQTVPDNYTKWVKESDRYNMLGNGWTVDIICHILKHMKLNNIDFSKT